MKEKKNISAKAFLATEQRIPGLGNGVLQDILFHAKLHPKRKIFSLSDIEKATLFRSLKNTLQAMADGGGRDTETDFLGDKGRYRPVQKYLYFSLPVLWRDHHKGSLYGRFGLLLSGMPAVLISQIK